MKTLDDELDLPMDEDENIEDEFPKKRGKRRKTKEERSADRRVVLWTLLFVLGVTLVFWMWPKIKGFKFEVSKSWVDTSIEEVPKSEWKNYMEYKL